MYDFWRFTSLEIKFFKKKLKVKKKLETIFEKYRSPRFQNPITLEEQKFPYKRYQAPKLGTNPGFLKIIRFSAFFDFRNLIF